MNVTDPAVVAILTVVVSLCSAVSALFGAALVAVVNWLATRKKTAAEAEFFLAQAEEKRINNASKILAMLANEKMTHTKMPREVRTLLGISEDAKI
jgi:hypothetical protein